MVEKTVFLRLENINKWFDEMHVLRNVTIDVKEGEFIALLGPSGCGKSTTLNIIAGFLIPEEGAVYIKGRDTTTVPANRRKSAMVFQNYALFPHLTAFENVAFGLRIRKEGQAEITRKVSEALELVRLPQVTDQFPSQLSGGQQQRIALARALVMEPEVLLLDEPLSNLDAKLREQMRFELRDIQQAAGVTTVFVTHDINEAFSLSDRIAVMNEGNIEQVGPPHEIYARPQRSFVAEFVGHSNRYGGILRRKEGECIFETQKGLKIFLPQGFEEKDGTEIAVLIRPERVMLSPERTDHDNIFRGTLKRLVYLGNQFEYVVEEKGGTEILVHAPNREGAWFQLESEVWVGWSREDVIPIG
jgi:ABC-type Fe3+/spermidine/putrescine transport system ATPase subunit